MSDRPLNNRHTRKRRCSFSELARSQRARLVKTAYELMQAIGEVFCPGGTRLELLDRALEHHTAGGAVSPAVGSTSSESSVSSCGGAGAGAGGAKRGHDQEEEEHNEGEKEDGKAPGAGGEGQQQSASKRTRR